MGMTKDQLVEKLMGLRTQRDQTLAQVNGLAGAIQILEVLLAEHYDSTAGTDKKD